MDINRPDTGAEVDHVQETVRKLERVFLFCELAYKFYFIYKDVYNENHPY